MAIKIKWNDADFKWDKAPTNQDDLSTIIPYTWNDVHLIETIAGQGGSGSGTEQIKSTIDGLDADKKKKLVHLILKRKGIKVYDQAKEVKSISIDIKDVELIIKEVKAQIAAENIHV